MPINTELVQFSRFMSELAVVDTIPKAKILRDKAEACRRAVEALNIDVLVRNQIARCAVEAERKIGAMLDQMLRTGERKTPATASDTESLALSDLGLSRKQSSRWQKIARIKDRAWDEFWADWDMDRREFRRLDLRRLMREPDEGGVDLPLPDGKFDLILGGPPLRHVVSQCGTTGDGT